MSEKTDHTVLLFDIPLFSKGKDELLSAVLHEYDLSRGMSYIVTPNPEQIIQAKQDKQFFQSLLRADFKIPDGSGLVTASQIYHWLGKKPQLKERIAGVEVAEELVAAALKRQHHILLIGGRHYSPTPTTTGIYLTQPGFNHVAWTPGYEDVTNPTDLEEVTLLELISQLKPKMVMVAFGAPHQELWVAQHASHLERAGVKLVMVVGGSFDYLLGVVPRAPLKMRQAGLEWLYRLWKQPWRWKRQLRLFQFVYLVAKESLKLLLKKNT